MVTGVDRLLQYVQYSRGVYSMTGCSIGPLRTMPAIRQVSTGLTVITEPMESTEVYKGRQAKVTSAGSQYDNGQGILPPQSI